MLRAALAAATVAIAMTGCDDGAQQRTFVLRLKAVAPAGQKVTAADLGRSVAIMRERLERLGISDPEVHTQGAGVIVIELPDFGTGELQPC
jgi:preprotein translocase subunit SecD